MYWSLFVDLSVFFSVVFSFWYWKSCRHSSKFPPGTVFEFDQIDFKYKCFLFKQKWKYFEWISPQNCGVEVFKNKTYLRN